MEPGDLQSLLAFLRSQDAQSVGRGVEWGGDGLMIFEDSAEEGLGLGSFR